MKRLTLLLLFTASTAFAQNYGGVWRPLDELKNGHPKQTQTQQQPVESRHNDIDISKLNYRDIEQKAKRGDKTALFLSGLMILTGQAGVEFSEDNVKRAIVLIQQAALRGSPEATAFMSDMDENGIEYALQRQIPTLPK